MTAAMLPLGLAVSVIAGQALHVRRRVPRLPDAAGAREGVIAGPAPRLNLQVVGESSVAGVGIERVEDSLTPALARRLGEACGREVMWQAHGWSGARVAGLTDRLLPRVATTVDLLVFVVGVNDVLRLTRGHVWQLGVEQVLRGVRRRFGDTPVAWVGLPQLGTFQALPQPLRAIAGARAEAMDRRALRVVRQRPNTWFVPTPHGDPRLVGADGFHPNEQGYRLWAEHIADVICPQIRPATLHRASRRSRGPEIAHAAVPRITVGADQTPGA